MVFRRFPYFFGHCNGPVPQKTSPPPNPSNGPKFTWLQPWMEFQANPGKIPNRHFDSLTDPQGHLNTCYSTIPPPWNSQGLPIEILDGQPYKGTYYWTWQRNHLWNLQWPLYPSFCEPPTKYPRIPPGSQISIFDWWQPHNIEILDGLKPQQSKHGWRQIKILRHFWRHEKALFTT